MLAFCSVCTIFWLFLLEVIFLIQHLFHRSFDFRISFSNITKTVSTGWTMSESFASVFGYYKILKVKHREKMFSNIFCSYITCWIFSSFNETLLSNECKTITLEVTQKGCTGRVVFCKTPAGDYFWWYYKEKCFLYFLALTQSFKEFFVLKAIPQRCPTKKVFCKYAASLLDCTHVEIKL